MEKVIKTIKELFELSNCEMEQMETSFYLNTKGFKDSRNNAEHYCRDENGKYNLTFYCDTKDSHCYDTIEFYKNVINNLLTKLTKKESEEKEMAIKIEKVKGLQNRIKRLEALVTNLERFDDDLITEKAREEYLEETQARLDSEMQESEIKYTGTLQLAAKLAEFSPDCETWQDDISNMNCSEQWKDYLEQESLSKEKLIEHLETLETPYKMYRRIESYLKKHQ